MRFGWSYFYNIQVKERLYTVVILEFDKNINSEMKLGETQKWVQKKARGFNNLQ